MTEINSSQYFDLNLELECRKCGLGGKLIPKFSEDSGRFYCKRCRPEWTPDDRFITPEQCAIGYGYLDGEQELNHVMSCTKATVVCPFDSCTSTSTLQDLRKHIEAYHQAYDQETPQLHFNSPTLGNTYHVNCITFDKFVLLFFIKLHRKYFMVNFQYIVYSVRPRYSERQEFSNLQVRLEIEVPTSDLKVTKWIQCKDIHNYCNKYFCAQCWFDPPIPVLPYRQSPEDRLKEKFNLPFRNDISFNVENFSKGDLFYTIKLNKKETVSQTDG